MTLRYISILFAAVVLALPLTACQDLGKGSRLAVHDAKESLEATEEKLKEVFGYRPKDEEYKPIPYSFCYQVLQDINCYTEPLPEARGRLVGWQGRGEFNIENTSRLPAKTALVRQPRKAPKRVAIKEVLEDKKEEKPEIVSLEPVFVPEAPQVNQGQGKTVTIKVDEREDDNLY